MPGRKRSITIRPGKLYRSLKLFLSGRGKRFWSSPLMRITVRRF
jgi:hypothetical protein